MKTVALCKGWTNRKQYAVTHDLNPQAPILNAQQVADRKSVTMRDMGAQTFEGVVEHGQIRLNSEVHIPEGAKVYVVVPDSEAANGRIHLRSPRLALQEQAADFEMQVIQP